MLDLDVERLEHTAAAMRAEGQIAVDDAFAHIATAQGRIDVLVSELMTLRPVH